MVKTFVHEVSRLVHLTINKELITTTYDHPFYVKGKGFLNAGERKAGEKVVDSEGGTCVIVIETIYLEIMENPETVYNFQVEDYHTYHVGNIGVLVHNKNYGDGRGVTEGGTGANAASRYGIDMDNLNFSNTVQNHTGGHIKITNY